MDAARAHRRGACKAAFAQPVSFANVLLLAAALHLCFRGKRRFLEDAAFSMHVVSFVLLSSVTLVLAHSFRAWLRPFIFLVKVLVGLGHFAYLAVAIRRFYLAAGRWSGWLLSVVAALFALCLEHRVHDRRAGRRRRDRSRLVLATGFTPASSASCCASTRGRRQ